MLDLRSFHLHGCVNRTLWGAAVAVLVSHTDSIGATDVVIGLSPGRPLDFQFFHPVLHQFTRRYLGC